MCVTSIAMPAAPSAASALPALKPNQPTQSMQAPVTVMVMLCGGMAESGNPLRRPSTRAQTRAAMPAFRCTTVPPAKSITPIFCSQPSPQTQCAIGQYTNSSQSRLNSSMPLKRTRSA
ncbi:hypothetical protein D3C83_18960 [compost metagenome]